MSEPVEKSRSCIFCGKSDVTLTREHAFPDWLNTYFDSSVVGINHIQNASGDKTWTNTAGMFSHKVRKVCKNCNNGWMSDIEGRSKKLIGELAFGSGQVRMTKYNQKIVALWVQKTMLVTNKAIPDIQYDIPAEFYKALNNSKTKPLNNIMVKVGRRSNFTDNGKILIARTGTAHIKHLNVPKEIHDQVKKQIDEGKGVWTGLMALGYLVMVVIGTNIAGEVEVGSDDEKILKLCVPYRGAWVWPSPITIEQGGTLEDIANGLMGEAFN